MIQLSYNQLLLMKHLCGINNSLCYIVISFSSLFDFLIVYLAPYVCICLPVYSLSLTLSQSPFLPPPLSICLSLYLYLSLPLSIPVSLSMIRINVHRLQFPLNAFLVYTYKRQFYTIYRNVCLTI